MASDVSVPSPEATKKVLVQLGDHCRVLEIPADCDRSQLISTVRSTYADKVSDKTTITLQIEEAEWGGRFIDFFGDTVVDKSVFRAIMDTTVR